jgi:VWFA-related protein
MAWLLLALAAALEAGGSQSTARQQQAPAAPADRQKPTFRTAVNFVRVDVYPRADGRSIDDLTRADFEIREDGVAQEIATFERIAIRGGVPADQRVDPRNVRESRELAADARNRVFVLFLDTFHVTDPAAMHNARARTPGSTVERMPATRRLAPPTWIDRALTGFLQHTVGPDDVIAAMTPEMDTRELTFVRRGETIEAFLKTTWARRFSLDELDPEQESFFRCYPPDDPQHRYDGIAEEMVVRHRELLTIQALRNLVLHLGELRDERKGVLLISEGWTLFHPNQQLARQLPGAPPPQAPGVFVGPGGKLAAGADPRIWGDGATWDKCEQARLRLANIDNEQTYLGVLDEANRANASFYVVDPRGLAVFDTPIDYRGINVPADSDAAGVSRPGAVTEDQARLRRRQKTLRDAATATDGLALLDSNDMSASLQRIVDDLSSYYLLGYYSTNAKADGTFRKISVSVKRAGVEVRTRRGYRAATALEVAARARSAEVVDPEVGARESALASLERSRVDRAARFVGGLGWGLSPDGAQPPKPVLWIACELDAAAARLPEWSGGSVASISVTTAEGTAVSAERVILEPGMRSFVRHVSDGGIAAGEYLLRVRLQGQPGSLADLTELVRVTVPAIGPGATLRPGDPLLYRRGPGPASAFQPAADSRFRRSDRLRLDVAIPWTDSAVSARLLDRRSQPLAVPPTAALREEAGVRVATAELTLLPLGPGDYLLELSVQHGQMADKVIAAFRVVP